MCKLCTILCISSYTLQYVFRLFPVSYQHQLLGLLDFLSNTGILVRQPLPENSASIAQVVNWAQGRTTGVWKSAMGCEVSLVLSSYLGRRPFFQTYCARVCLYTSCSSHRLICAGRYIRVFVKYVIGRVRDVRFQFFFLKR